MKYTREDEALGAAMGVVMHSGFVTPYLSNPTPASDYECLEWAREKYGANAFHVVIRRELDIVSLMGFLSEYEPGVYARALYAVLMEE